MKIIKNVSLCGTLTDIAVEDGKIAKIGKCEEEGVDFGGARIFPGLIDVHSHGCIGCTFEWLRGEIRATPAEHARYQFARMPAFLREAYAGTPGEPPVARKAIG